MGPEVITVDPWEIRDLASDLGLVGPSRRSRADGSASVSFGVPRVGGPLVVVDRCWLEFSAGSGKSKKFHKATCVAIVVG
jgi:hypothetical protein